MRRFNRPYEDRSRVSTPTGSRYVNKMCLLHLPSGGRVLEKTGETDLQALIDSYRESCDLSMILEKCMVADDLSLLQQVQGTFVDISCMPEDLRAAHDLLNHAKLFYESLPVQQKSRFTGFGDFFSQCGDVNKILELFGDNKQSIVSDRQSAVGQDVQKSEVKVDES